MASPSCVGDAGGARSDTTITIMVAGQKHHTCVAVWMERAAEGLPAEKLLQLFEQGFGAIWVRAQLALGEVTLTAIADRALYVATARYPYLGGVKVVAGALLCGELKERAASLHHRQLVEAIGFVLVEFLTVLGKLTAEVLTPALHAALLDATGESGLLDCNDVTNAGAAQSR